MQTILDDIRALGGEVLAVSFGQPASVAAFARDYPLPFPVLADPDRAGYEAFGLGKTSATAIMFSPSIIGHYLRLILRGWIPKKPEKNTDLWQLGGDIILDRAGRVRYLHPSEDPSDRPSPAALLQAFRAACADG